MASAGAGIRAYHRFIAYAFKQYDDIDEVFVQSTYWGRSRCNKSYLDEKKTFSLEFFIQKDFERKC